MAGLKFLTENNKNNKCDIKKIIGDKAILFPESTKTNRLSVLNIRSNIMSEIYKCVQKNEIKIRSEIIINRNSYFNTTDSIGFYSLFSLCLSLYTPIEIISQDIPNMSFDDNDFDNKKFDTIDEYYDSIIQEYLMEPEHRNNTKLSLKDHQLFLEYYNQTINDKKGKYVNQKHDTGKMTEFDDIKEE